MGTVATNYPGQPTPLPPSPGAVTATTIGATNVTALTVVASTSLTGPVYDQGGAAYNVRAAPFAATGGGTLDDTAAINAAIVAAQTAGGGSVIVPPGIYLALGIAPLKGVSLWGMPGAIIRKNGGAAGTFAINAQGTITATTSVLTAPVALGAMTVTVTAATGFAVGDDVLLYDLTYKDITNSNGRNQEMNRIAAIVGTTITLELPTIASYASASTATLTKIVPVSGGTIGGLTVQIPTGTAGGGIQLSLCRDMNVTQNTVTGPNDRAGIWITQSKDILVTKNSVSDGQVLGTGGPSYGYGVNESSYGVSFIDNVTRSVTENIASNNARYVVFERNCDYGSYDSSWNTHGSGCEQVDIRNNVSIGAQGQGIAVGFHTSVGFDQHITVEANTVINSVGSGITVDAPTATPHRNIYLLRNIVRNWKANGGAVGGSGITVAHVTTGTIFGNICDANSGSGAVGIYLQTVTDVEVEHNVIKNLSAGAGSLIRWENLDGACNRLRIQRNRTLASAGPYHLLNSGTNTSTLIAYNTSDASLATASFGTNDIHHHNRFANDANDGDYASVSGTQTLAATNSTTLTITTQNVSEVIPITAAGSLTGVIAQAGIFTGQRITVLNVSANTFTFDVAGTSHVAEGTTAVIGPYKQKSLVYSAGSALWYMN